MKNYRKTLPLLMTAMLISISACSSNDDDNDFTANDDNSGVEAGSDDVNDIASVDGTGGTDDTVTSYAYSFNRTPFGTDASARIQRISLTDGNTIDGEYPSTTTDHALATDGNDVYQIGRFFIDNLTQFDPIDTSIVGYQLSLIGEGDSTTNPQSLVFVNEDVAYLTRRATDSLLILDPTPETNTTESLITGSLSLADYNTGSGDDLLFADMTDALIVDDKLFVLMENLNASFAPDNPGFVAVFDTNTNQEIQTGEASIPFNGIQLEVSNPTGLQFNEDTGMVYVVGRGNVFNNPQAPGDPFTGGLEVIDPNTFESSLLVDDGDANNNNDFFNSAVVVDAELAYVMTIIFDADFNPVTNLRTINLATAEISEPVTGLEGLNMTIMEIGPDNHLWIGIESDAPGYMRVDLETGLVAPEMVRTDLIPSDLVFLEVSQ